MKKERKKKNNKKRKPCVPLDEQQSRQLARLIIGQTRSNCHCGNRFVAFDWYVLQIIPQDMEQKEIYIETERIIIRNFKQKDAEGLLEYLSNPRVNCFAGDRLCSEEAAWAYMQYSPKDMLRYAVSLKKDDFIIGDVFALRENEDTYNVGWHFNKRFEGKGFACEAAAGLLDYLFREAGARRIYGFVEDDNIRSKRLCERLGMRREGCFKEFVTFVNNPDGSPKYEDTCVYAILEKEWNTIRQW